MTFCFYVEPATVAGDSDSECRQLYVGVGESDTGGEQVCVGIFEEYRNKAAILLSRDEVRDLVDVLMESLGAMDAEAMQ